MRGRTWTPAGRGVARANVTAVAVGQGQPGRVGIVYAGTEPSALFRSSDGGETWEELHNLATLPSASTWSFPPRPETHHVRWIAVDPHDARSIYAAIEAGALVRSQDGGETWTDRTPEGPYDTHTLALHPHARGRLYSAAGERKGGGAWAQVRDGLPEPKGTTISVFATLRDRPHTIYAANNRGIFHSRDAGVRWEILDVPWPGRFIEHAVQGLVLQES